MWNSNIFSTMKLVLFLLIIYILSSNTFCFSITYMHLRVKILVITVKMAISNIHKKFLSAIAPAYCILKNIFCPLGVVPTIFWIDFWVDYASQPVVQTLSTCIQEIPYIWITGALSKLKKDGFNSSVLILLRPII